MKQVNLFEPDNKKWTCSTLYGSSRSELYSIVFKPLCFGLSIPGTTFSSIFNSTNRGGGTAYSQGHAIPHYYRMIINTLKAHLISIKFQEGGDFLLPPPFRF